MNDYLFTSIYSIPSPSLDNYEESLQSTKENLNDYLFPNGISTYNTISSDYPESEVVFQGAPVTVEQVTIPKIQQVEEIPQMMGQVMKILIPIGLIVFSIGLVIYLTRLVISRVQ